MDNTEKILDFIEDKGLDFHIGNAVLLICTAGKAGSKQYVKNIKQAAAYLKRRLEVKEPITMSDGKISVRDFFDAQNLDGVLPSVSLAFGLAFVMEDAEEHVRSHVMVMLAFLNGEVSKYEC